MKVGGATVLGKSKRPNSVLEAVVFVFPVCTRTYSVIICRIFNHHVSLTMTPSAASSSTTNTSAFDFDEIEKNSRLRSLINYDINDAITQDQLGVDDNVTDQNDGFLARLRVQVIDPELELIYKACYDTSFLWLRLPQPNKGIACP